MGPIIEPGMFVICVDGDAGAGLRWAAGESLTVGALYQVGDCWINDRGNPVISIVGKERLDGSRAWGQRVGYRVTRFRPLLDPLTPAPEAVLERIGEDA